MNTTYIPRNVKLADLWATIELHVRDHGELPKRLGKCIKGLGGSYSECRGHQHERYVTVPAHARRTIEDIYAMFRVDTVILRGATQLLRDLHGGERIKDTVVHVLKGQDPLTLLYRDERNYTAAEWGLAESVRQGRDDAAIEDAVRKAKAQLERDVAAAAPQLRAALLVLTTTPHIVRYLSEHDPKALEQAQQALTLTPAAPSFNFAKAA